MRIEISSFHLSNFGWIVSSSPRLCHSLPFTELEMAKSPQVKEDSIAEHHDDPDQLFVEASVAEVRAIEQRTR